MVLTVAAVLGGIVGILLASSYTCSKLREAFGPPYKRFDISTDLEAELAKVAREGWLYRALIAFDIASNVIVFKGQQDETISTHCWRAMQEGKTWGRLACKWLDGYQDDHGIIAAVGDLQRASARVEVLKKALGLQ